MREEVRGQEKFTRYETPVGTLQARHVYSQLGNTWFIVDHPVTTAKDFEVLTYINEHTVIEPNMAKFAEDYQRLGDSGLYLPIIGSESKTSFQSLLEFWVGTENLVYALMDFPEVVEATLAAMQANSLKTVEISVDAEAEAFIFWEDSSTTNISPGYFARYAAPEINAWGEMIHDAHKLLIHHACGHLRALLPAMGQTNIDCVESISPPPTGDIELWEAQEILPKHIALIGGIEPTVFLQASMDQLETYVAELLARMGTQRYILANSDSCPPGVSIDKFRLVTQMVQTKR